MKNKKGFTLIELLVVIAIIGVLATIAVSSVSTARGKARNVKRKTDLKTISTAIEYYNINNNSYSVIGTTCGTNGVIATSLGANICSGSVFKDSVETYLSAIPSSPNSGEYSINTGANGNPPCIYTGSLESESAGAYFMCQGGNCKQSTTAPSCN